MTFPRRLQVREMGSTHFMSPYVKRESPAFLTWAASCGFFNIAKTSDTTPCRPSVHDNTIRSVNNVRSKKNVLENADGPKLRHSQLAERVNNFRCAMQTPTSKANVDGSFHGVPARIRVKMFPAFSEHENLQKHGHVHIQWPVG